MQSQQHNKHLQAEEMRPAAGVYNIASLRSIDKYIMLIRNLWK